MDSKELIKKLFGEDRIVSQAKAIARELRNRDLFPLIDFPQLIDDDCQKHFIKQCTAFYKDVFNIIVKGKNLEHLLSTDKKLVWLNMAHWMSNKEKFDTETYAIYICIGLIAERKITLDEHVNSLKDASLLEELRLKADDEMLVSLSDTRINLKRRAIIVDENIAVYPHQFMRRYYTSNFVDLPIMLAKAKEAELDVLIRLDPLRKTSAKNYTKEGLFEADHWHGPPFSKRVLDDKYLNERTLHLSNGVVNLNYDVRYTVFRTSMMHSGLRQFSIEEYCPFELPNGDLSPAWGNKYYIQKFGHLVYDQVTKHFEHVDGAVRVFAADEYEKHFDDIQSGFDIDEKAGIRHKMFQVKRQPNTPGFELKIAQALLTEWFRYNPHIYEYFSNTEVEMPISYAKIDKLKSKG